MRPFVVLSLLACSLFSTPAFAAWDIFQSTGVTERFGVPDERFKAFLGRMELLYSVENPYHCALHAAVRHCAARPRLFSPVGDCPPERLLS